MPDFIKTENYYKLQSDLATVLSWKGDEILSMAKELADLPFLLLILSGQQKVTDQAKAVLLQLKDELEHIKGALVLVVPQADHRGNTDELPMVPTEDEGIDYLYMEKIERELSEDFGE